MFLLMWSFLVRLLGQGALNPCYLWLFPKTVRTQQPVMSSNMVLEVVIYEKVF